VWWHYLVLFLSSPVVHYILITCLPLPPVYPLTYILSLPSSPRPHSLPSYLPLPLLSPLPFLVSHSLSHPPHAILSYLKCSTILASLSKVKTTTLTLPCSPPRNLTNKHQIKSSFCSALLCPFFSVLPLYFNSVGVC
jgi:hypothetical protein